MDNLLECKICWVGFERVTPKILNCGHSFCEECLFKILDRNGKISCAVCRKETFVPNGNISVNIPTNFIVKSLAEKGTEEKRNKPSANKKVVTDHNTVMFCEDPQCMKLICRKCTNFSHQSHPQKIIEDAAQVYREILTEKVDIVKTVLDQINNDVELVKKDIMKVQKEKSKVEKSIRESMQRLKDLIFQRETALLDDLYTETNKILAILEQKNHTFTTISKQATDAIQVVESHLSITFTQTNNNNHRTYSLAFLENTKDCLQKLDAVLSLKWNYSTPSAFLDFSDFGEEVDTLILSIGQVVKLPQYRDFSMISPNGLQEPLKIFGPALLNEKTPLHFPRFLAIIPSSWWPKNSAQRSRGDLLVISDTQQHRLILIEKATGRVFLVIGGSNKVNTNSTSPCQLKYPYGVTAIRCSSPPFVRICVVEKYNDRVEILDAETGGYLHHFSNLAHMKEPSGIAWIKESGNLVVANSQSHTLTVHKGYKVPSLQDSVSSLNLNDEFITSCGELINIIQPNSNFNPNSVCLNSKGNLIVSSETEIFFFDSETNNFKFIRSFKVNNQLLSSLHGVAIDSFDNILVCDRKNHIVNLLKQDGTVLHSIGREGNEAGFFQSPTGILLDPLDGLMYVVDCANHRIQVF